MNNHMVCNQGDLLLIVKYVELGQTLKIHKESHGLEPWRSAFNCKRCGTWFRHCRNMNNHMVWNHGDLLLIVIDVELGSDIAET